MPVEDAFARHVEEQGLVRTAPLERLRGTRVAVDAHHWMNDLASEIREPYQAVMGGCAPHTLRQAVLLELMKFKRAGLFPVFVFNGLPMVLSQTPKMLSQNPQLLAGYERQEEVWKAKHEGRHSAADGKLGARFAQPQSSMFNTEIQFSLIAVLQEQDVEVFKAPYMAWAQMAYWCQESARCVHQILGPNDLLMFDHVETLLLKLNFTEKTFTYISKAQIKQSLDTPESDELTDSQFLDVCLLSGLRGQINHPKHYPNNVHLANIASSIRSAGNAKSFFAPKGGRSAATASNGAARNHMRLRTVIKHGLVLTLAGRCVPMSDEDGGKANGARRKKGAPATPNGQVERVPSNLSDLWGHRLPNVLYFLLSIGAIQTQMLITVVQNAILEAIPQVDTEEYRELLRRILPLRCLVAQQLIRYLKEGKGGNTGQYQRPRMKCWRYDVSGQREIAPNPPPIFLDEWDVRSEEIDVMRRLSEDTESCLDFVFVVRNFSVRATKHKTYSTFDEVVCAIHLKALDLLGYFTHAPSGVEHIEEASGLSRFGEALRQAGEPEFSQHVVLLIELLRTGALTPTHFTYLRPTTDPKRARRSVNPWDVANKSEIDRTHFPVLQLPRTVMAQPERVQRLADQSCLLISRIWSLLPLKVKEEAWMADVSKDLLAFNTVVKAMHKTLRGLVEVVTCSLYLSGAATIDLVSDAYHLPQSLPFGQKASTAFGIVINYILRSSPDFGENCSTPEERLRHIESKFSCCKALEDDLHRGMRLWVTIHPLFMQKLEDGTPIFSTPQDRSAQEWGQLQHQFVLADAYLRQQLSPIIDISQYSAVSGP